MPGKHVIRNVHIELDGERLEERVRSVSFARVASVVDVTNFKSGGHAERLSGLFDGTVDIEFQQDFANTGTKNKVYDTLKDLLGTTVVLKVDPTVGTFPHEAEVMVYVNELPFFGGAVGSLSTFSVSWPFADMDGPVFTEAALFTTTLQVGESGTETGMIRDGGVYAGRLNDQRALNGELGAPVGWPGTRIINFHLNTQSPGSLFIRVNRPRDLKDKWLMVDDQYLQMTEFAASSSAGEELIELDSGDRPTTWATHSWTDGALLPVAIYSTEPAGVTLSLPAPIKILSGDFEVAVVASEQGFHDDPGGFGALGPNDNGTWSQQNDGVRGDGNVDIDEFFYNSSSTSWSLIMGSSSQARSLDKMWVRVVRRDNGYVAMKAQLEYDNSATLDFVDPQPGAPTTLGSGGWQVGDHFTFELWDRDPG